MDIYGLKMCTVVLENIDPVKLEGMEDIDPLKLEVTMEEHINNPWTVGDASAFLKYCCPECDYQILNLQMFTDHALENHSKAVALFGHVSNVGKIELKKERQEDVDVGTNDTMEIGDMGDEIATKDEIIDPFNSPNLCSFCDFSSTSIIDILQHHRDLHEYEIPPFFKCNDCDFFHRKKKIVKDHCLERHGKTFVPYKCKTCSQRKYRIQTFRGHLRECVPSLCSFCDFSSTSVIHMVKHYTDQHEDVLPPIFHCDYCEFYHRKKKCLQAHSRKTHGKHFLPHKCKKFS